MRTWKNTIEAAREALANDAQVNDVHEAGLAGCETCGHYLGDGNCAVGLEMECRDGGFEAWKARDEEMTPQSASLKAPLAGEPMRTGGSGKKG